MIKLLKLKKQEMQKLNVPIQTTEIKNNDVKVIKEEKKDSPKKVIEKKPKKKETKEKKVRIKNNSKVKLKTKRDVETLDTDDELYDSDN